MAVPKLEGSQTDFSAGELDVAMKRADHTAMMKSGARQMSNWRILNSHAVTNRPGRSALFLETGRVDKILMSPGNTFYLVFGNGFLKVYNAAGTFVFGSAVKGDGTTPIPWTLATVKNISFAIAASSQLSIYIAYADGAPNNVPQVLTWDGISQTSAWTLTTFAETIAGSGQKRTFFTRISPQGINLQPSATTGNITLTASASLFVAGMVGTRLLWCGKQVFITGVSSATVASALVIEPLPSAQALSLTGATGNFVIGDVVIGATTGSTGIITSNSSQQAVVLNPFSGSFAIGATATGGTSGATGTIIALTQQGLSQITLTIQLSTGTTFVVGENVTVSTGGSGHVTAISGNTLVAQLIPKSGGNVSFFTTEAIAGPNGSATISAQSVGTPQSVGLWDDEVMNIFRGYPTSVFFDQVRLGFCNFPALPSGIGWSAIGLPADMFVAPIGQAITSSSAIFEFAPGKSQVLYVVPGMESSEFILCDNAIYYIPITASVPLTPGSVAFTAMAEFGVAQVQPHTAEQSIIFVKAGSTAIGAIQAPGAYYRPYIVDSISENHSHLFTASAPIAIAIPSTATQYDETYIYVLLANGTQAVGRYVMKGGLIEAGEDGKAKVGWLPWSGAGTTTWISAQGTDLVFTTSYAPNGVTAVSIVERVDNTQYLDGTLLVNNLPAPFTPPGGKGPLFKFPGPNSTVVLMDLGTRQMDVYQVDANGFIIPQNIGGENLASSQLVAGQMWTAILEPFAPIAQSGQSVKQRLRKRRTSWVAAYVSNSTGFLWARLFGGPLYPGSPALGAQMNTRRVTTYNQGDDPTQAPPLREEVESWRPIGKDHDVRRAIIKDTAGPLTVHEIAMEVSV